jgi:lysozyme
MFTTSPEGKKLIKESEGLRLSAYLCPAGVWTIGYGHTRTATKGMRITEQQADNLFDRDISVCEKCVNNAVTVKINQQMFDALVSFVFNFGCPRFQSSTMLRLLNQGDYVGAAQQFSRWVYGTNPKTGKKEQLPGLVARRAKERQMFEAGMLQLMGTPKPTADIPEENKRYPVKSTTNAGLAVTTAGIVGSEVTTIASDLSPLTPHSSTIQTVFVILSLIGIGLAAWGRYKVYRDSGR